MRRYDRAADPALNRISLSLMPGPYRIRPGLGLQYSIMASPAHSFGVFDGTLLCHYRSSVNCASKQVSTRSPIHARLGKAHCLCRGPGASQDTTGLALGLTPSFDVPLARMPAGLCIGNGSCLRSARWRDAGDRLVRCRSDA